MLHNIYIIRLILAAILFCDATSLCAQQLQATRHHYTTADGLASNVVSHIKQDDYGFIWIATWNGLSRFNGYEFYNYKTGVVSHIPNLHNRISQIEIDNQQNIWMRMYDGRIFVMKRSIDRIINPFENISGSDEFKSSSPFYVTSSGDVLIFFDGVGLYKVRMEPDGINAQLITSGELTITSIAEGYQDDIWLGTNHGVRRLDASNLSVEHKGFFTDENITCLYSNGYNIFAGTQSGKILSFSYNPETQEFRSGGTPIASLFVDSHGIIWYTDSRMGVTRIDPENNTEKSFAQIVKTPDYDGHGGIFHESNGVVWIILNRGGFGYYNRERDELEYFHNDPSNPWNLSNTIYAMYPTSDGVLFEATSRRGLEKLEIINRAIERRNLVENGSSSLDNEIRGLFYDKARKQLLISNKASALFIIKDDSTRTELKSSDNGQLFGRIYGISKDSKGNYWLASKDNGVFKMTNTNNGYSITNYQHSETDEHSLSNNHAYYCLEDKSGNIWVATYGGGVNILPKGEKRFLTPKKGIKSYPINSFQKVRTIALDKNGNVWAGTTDGILILSYKDGNASVKKLEPSEEYKDKVQISNDIVCIEQDPNGNMWIGTNGGGLSYTSGQDSKGRWLFENITTNNGLPSDEIKSITFDLKGHVWFSTESNICSYDTNKRILSVYSTLEGIDETECSESSVTTLANGHIIFGTLNGYYYIDQDKLVTTNGALLKLRICDFWVNDILQSPSLNDLYDYYVPDSKSVTLPSTDTRIAIRFVSLNYQLQHRVHYQYMLEGVDEDWINADDERIAYYDDGLPPGTHKFKVKAFLIDSPDKYDLKEISIVVPANFFSSPLFIWILIIVVAVIALCIIIWLYRSNKKLKTSHTYSIKNQPSPDNERIEKAKNLLENTDDSIAEISFNAGFSNAAEFNRIFLEATGMTPLQYRDKNTETNNS